MSLNTVFTLSSGRSGTLSLCELLRRNAAECTVVHEPHISRSNPSMFGRPIYDYATRNIDAIHRLLKTKRDTIRRFNTPTYIETSHAFLKSYWEFAPEYFQNMKVFHLVRHPLEVARSEANREAFINKWRLPLRQYRGRDRQKYCRWALTGLEPIFAPYQLDKLTMFQRYVIQWIEIENRAMAFLKRFDMDRNCLTLLSPRDLNDPQTVTRILHFLNFDSAGKEVTLPGVQNRTPGNPTIVGDAEMRQFREVMSKMPAEHLEIFHHDPYKQYPWVDLLTK